ncbi:M48 family metallopeptidase [Piscinibacter terrae]|uniref:M48 family peptidase n=1 Tax=Piscinibacter terrae TaxID=2496871 RepID=A0A3N7HQG3_9BURK|nr:M48 family metallopeptidase [Albitalea terrae]RQP24467.1 M48 family peptidase [Albitalea terrae]
MSSDSDFQTDYVPSPSLQPHAFGCQCALHSRRRFTALVAGAGLGATLPAVALADGVEVGERSQLSGLVSAEQLEKAAQQQYRKMLAEASSQRALAPDSHPQVVRLRAIAQRLIPHIMSPNLHSTPRAADWNWEVNLIGSKQINAFCMPGGKIAFYYGILDQLKLTDDEVAMVMGHEIAHALREHARERMGKSAVTNSAIEIGAALLGLGNGGRYLAGLGGQLLSLRFSRGDESEADKVGLDLAARAGYDPRAGVTLWEKMGQASKGAPPQWLSTHPSGATRIEEIQASLPLVLPVYQKAPKPTRRFDESLK